jgi:hypothetical protein
LSIRKRLEITIETEQMLIVRRRYSTRLWCSKCGCETDFVPLDQIVPRKQTRPFLETTGKAAEAEPARSLHIRETHDSPALVCLDSVLAFWAQEESKTRPKSE